MESYYMVHTYTIIKTGETYIIQYYIPSPFLKEEEEKSNSTLYFDLNYKAKVTSCLIVSLCIYFVWPRRKKTAILRPID